MAKGKYAGTSSEVAFPSTFEIFITYGKTAVDLHVLSLTRAFSKTQPQREQTSGCTRHRENLKCLTEKW
jgi:hypothetical protein